MYKNILIFFALVWAVCMQSYAYIISGTVCDVKTRETLPYVHVVCDKNVTISDISGYFQIESSKMPCSVTASFVGYKKKTVPVNLDSHEVVIYMEEDITLLKDIVIVPDDYYCRSLLKKIIKNRVFNNPDHLRKIMYKERERSTILLANLGKRLTDSSSIFVRSEALIMDADSTKLLPVMIGETTTLHSRDKDAKLDTVSLVNKDSEILLEGLSQQIESVFLKKLTTDFNFYDNTIDVLQHGFPSPISPNWNLYYKIYLEDSIMHGDIKHYKFRFYPKNKRDISFRGFFWAEGRTWAITQLSASLPDSANLNFVSNFRISVDYQPDNQTQWYYKTQSVSMNLSLVDVKEGKTPLNFVVRKQNLYTLIDSDSLTEKLSYDAQDNYHLSDSLHSVSLSYEEIQAKALRGMQNLKKKPSMIFFDKLSTMTMNGYYNAGPIDIGPYFSFFSINDIEGVKLGVPIRTSEKLFKNFTIGGNVSYGFKNSELSYGGQMAYRFKSEHRTILSANYAYDYLELTRNKYNEFIRENPYQQGGGNILSSVTTYRLNPYLFRNQHADMTFEYEFKKDIGLLVRPSYDCYFSTPFIPFSYLNAKSEQVSLSEFRTQTLLLDLRFSHDMDYDDLFFARIYYGNEKPVYHLSAMVGRYEYPTDGISGYYAHINASIKNRFNIGSFRLSLLGECGGILGDVPYPLLNLPRGTCDLGQARYHYNLLYNASFVSDVYVNIHAVLNTGGFLFNKIPLIRGLNLREIFTVKSFYGLMLGNHNGVMQIPAYLKTPSEYPYMEVSAGITNIFKCLRVDYVRRLNSGKYFDSISAKRGIRLRIEVNF